MFDIYKKGQGIATRWVTAATLGALSAFGAYELRLFLSEKLADDKGEYTLLGVLPWSVLVSVVVFVLAMIGVALVINSKRFVDYLIASETELRKVAWPRRNELKQQTIIVIVALAFFALMLHAADILFGLGSTKFFLK